MNIYVTLDPTDPPGNLPAWHLDKMLKQGISGVRINMVRWSIEKAREAMRYVRDKQEDIEIMLDIGQKMRLLVPQDKREVRVGDKIQVYLKPTENGDICFNHQVTLKAGERVIIRDGKINGRVEETDDERAMIVIESTYQPDRPVELENNGGVNLPDSVCPFLLSNHDDEAVGLGLEEAVNMIAVSFVEKPRHVQIFPSGYEASNCPRVIAKVETAKGIENLPQLVLEDPNLPGGLGFMVPRGDLWLNIPIHEFPWVQEQFISLCHAHHVPVMVATRLLTDYALTGDLSCPQVMDLANAIRSGADILFSDETSRFAKFPINCIELAKKIADAKARVTITAEEKAKVTP